MTRVEAERLARFLILGLDSFDWNARICGPYRRSEFLLCASGGEVVLNFVPTEAGDFSFQAATLEPEAFRQWNEQNRTDGVLRRKSMESTPITAVRHLPARITVQSKFPESAKFAGPR